MRKRRINSHYGKGSSGAGLGKSRVIGASVLERKGRLTRDLGQTGGLVRRLPREREKPGDSPAT